MTNRRISSELLMNTVLDAVPVYTVRFAVISGRYEATSGRAWHQTLNLSLRGKRIADCQFVVYDLSILEVFGIQSFAFREQRRGHNRRVIK